MAEWFALGDAVMGDPRVAGLSPVAFRGYVVLRWVAARAELGGVCLVPSGRGAGRVAFPEPRLRRDSSPRWVAPAIPHWRALHALLDAGLLVPHKGGYRLHDWEVWERDDARRKARRDAALARKRSRGVGPGSRPRFAGTVPANHEDTGSREPDHAGSRELPDIGRRERAGRRSLSPTVEPSERSSPTVRVHLAPWDQTPGDDGLRDFVRVGIRLAVNTGEARVLDDLPDDAGGGLTETETAAVEAARGRITPAPDNPET